MEIEKYSDLIANHSFCEELEIEINVLLAKYINSRGKSLDVITSAKKIILDKKQQIRRELSKYKPKDDRKFISISIRADQFDTIKKLKNKSNVSQLPDFFDKILENFKELSKIQSLYDIGSEDASKYHKINLNINIINYSERYIFLYMDEDVVIIDGEGNIKLDEFTQFETSELTISISSNILKYWNIKQHKG